MDHPGKLGCTLRRKSTMFDGGGTKITNCTRGQMGSNLDDPLSIYRELHYPQSQL